MKGLENSSYSYINYIDTDTQLGKSINSYSYLFINIVN